MTVPKWTRPARADLGRIIDYLDTVEPALAAEVVVEFFRATRRLEAFPASGAPIGRGAYKLSIPRYRYLIIYRIVAGRAVIVRVRHTSQNWAPR